MLARLRDQTNATLRFIVDNGEQARAVCQAAGIISGHAVIQELSVDVVKFLHPVWTGMGNQMVLVGPFFVLSRYTD